jgi:hypothetical protein
VTILVICIIWCAFGILSYGRVLANAHRSNDGFARNSASLICVAAIIGFLFGPVPLVMIINSFDSFKESFKFDPRIYFVDHSDALCVNISKTGSFPPWPGLLNDEVVEWLAANCHGRYYSVRSSANDFKGSYVKFENANDAVNFKLAWG